MTTRSLYCLSIAALLPIIIFSTSAPADIVFHTSGKTDFLNALGSDYASLGTDTFNSMTGVGDGQIKSFADPLSHGVTSAYFQNGSTIPVTIQSNTLGDAPASASPRGADGLHAYNGLGDTVVYSGDESDSLDIIPEAKTAAVSWVQRLVGLDRSTIRVYGENDAFLASWELGAMGWDAYVGVQATAGETITRVNIYAHDASTNEGLNELTLFQRTSLVLQDNKADFDYASAHLTCLGTEDFENSTLNPPRAQWFDDSLTQGVANGPYDNGVSIPVTIQSHNGSDPSAVSPRGQVALAHAEAGFAGLASAGVLANWATDALDIIMIRDDIQAVSFNLIGYAADTVDVLFYDINGVFLGEGSRGSDPSGDNFIGYVAEEDQYIGRVHIVSQNALQQGIDNLSVCAVPEPMTMALLAAGLPALLKRRRRGI